MRSGVPFWSRLGVLLTAAAVLAGCTSSSSPSAEPGSESLEPSAPATSAIERTPTPVVPGESADAERPEWFDLQMTDVQTGEAFTINDFEDQVVLLETMAVWCPTCRRQGDEVKRLHGLLDHPDDLVSISLDVDMNEDEELLRDYAERLGYDWHFAVAPLPVVRALGNLYSAQYLNPPVSPMLVIDREGNVLGLPFGSVKDAESLLGVVEPLLDS